MYHIAGLQVKSIAIIMVIVLLHLQDALRCCALNNDNSCVARSGMMPGCTIKERLLSTARIIKSKAKKHLFVWALNHTHNTPQCIDRLNCWQYSLITGARDM